MSMGTTDTPTSTDSPSNLERLLSEALALDRQGKLDQAALATFESHIQKEFDQDSQKTAQLLARLEQPSGLATPQPLRGWRLTAVLVALIFVLAGAPLELNLGSGFVFALASEYRAAAPWVFLALLPLFTVFFVRAEKRRRHLRMPYPTWWVRSLLVFPLVIAVASAAVVVAPLGWAALVGWVVGTTAELQARVVTVGSLSKGSRGCDQKGELLVNGATAAVCFEGRLVGPAPTAGETVVVNGRTSRIGVFVNEIQKR